MIPVKQAIATLNENLNKGPVHQVSLSSAVGHILAEDVYAPVNLPPFDQSAMDGYAVAIGCSPTYTVIANVAAGEQHDLRLEAGQAARIFTGAAIPEGANAVVMQEKVQQNGSTIHVTDVEEYDNIRPGGEQIMKGDLALSRGTALTPAAVGFLSAMGIEKISVYRKPRISILVSGDELVYPGNDLQHGQIYESNSAHLKAALASEGITQVTEKHVRDEFETTKQEIKKAISRSDIVIITGGISVGDYDFAGQAVNELGVNELFYKVAQKPGKPIYAGKKSDTLVFALPGNPASCLTGFYIYVLPAVRHFLGYTESHLKRKKRRISSAVTKKEGRALFLKAKLKDDNTVEILEGQSSAMLHTFSIADALIYLSPDQVVVEEGDEVDTILLPVRTN
ncbi:gephyrin-like molybdotransferase Glp [Halalkalibaculum sp. DA3122]|uniref:molybdopterin molybdotransferase MoeA n=1 Tax=Halalkalibaculum sp. DA3122 TaxID=3373607 RepID=UPI0037547916